GIGRITRFDASGLKSQIAGEVKDFDPHKYIDSESKVRRRARHTQFALAATAMALEDAGIDLDRERPERSLPVIMGLASSSLEMIFDGALAIAAKGPRHANPTIISESSPNSVVGAITELLGIPTQCLTLATGCAAGLDAAADAAERIRRGEADIVLAGGTEAPISMLPIANFDSAGMASRRNDAPEEASRPF